MGRRGKQRGAKYLGRAGFGSTRGGGGIARGGKSGLDRELSLVERGGGGRWRWRGYGHLIWIGSSQPNVSAGSQHAW